MKFLFAFLLCLTYRPTFASISGIETLYADRDTSVSVADTSEQANITISGASAKTIYDFMKPKSQITCTSGSFCIKSAPGVMATRTVAEADVYVARLTINSKNGIVGASKVANYLNPTLLVLIDGALEAKDPQPKSAAAMIYESLQAEERAMDSEGQFFEKKADGISCQHYKYRNDIQCFLEIDVIEGIRK